jgi:hypothetical protein
MEGATLWSPGGVRKTFSILGRGTNTYRKTLEITQGLPRVGKLKLIILSKLEFFLTALIC